MPSKLFHSLQADEAKALLCALLVGVLVALPQWVSAVDEHIPDFRTSYVIEKAGVGVVRITISLKRGEGRIEYRSKAEPIGMASWFFGDYGINTYSILQQVEDKVIPLQYRSIHLGSEKDRNEHYRYDWKRNLAYVDYRGEQKTLRIPNGTLDTFSLQLALMQNADEGPKKIKYSVISRGKLKTYTCTNLGLEAIETPLGRFEAVVLERRPNDEKSTTFTTWHAPRLHYLPVKIENRENGDVVLSLLLEEVQWR
jgi:Protein of unknown function (DUF3108)